MVGVKGVKKITATLVEEGCEALKEFTKAAKETDKIESDFAFAAEQTLKGQYGIDDKDELGFILKATVPAAAGVEVGGEVGADFESSQTGKADVTLKISLKISARDRAKDEE